MQAIDASFCWMIFWLVRCIALSRSTSGCAEARGPSKSNIVTQAKIEQRMRYVFALFRMFHNAPEVFSRPNFEMERLQITKSVHFPG